MSALPEIHRDSEGLRLEMSPLIGYRNGHRPMRFLKCSGINLIIATLALITEYFNSTLSRFASILDRHSLVSCSSISSMYCGSAEKLRFAAPRGFPKSGNGIWFNATATDWAHHYLRIGNKFLGAMTPGGTDRELTQLNIKSLWTGGPFADPVGLA